MEVIMKDTIHEGGKAIDVRGIRLEDKHIVFVQRGPVTIARLRDEWYDDVGDPALILNTLEKCRPMPDLFTFWQRLPDTVPMHPYHREEEALSAVPLKDFDHWWKTQINSDARKKAKRAEKRGVEIRTVTLDDDLVRGVMGIFNETPIRQGKRFWHYGKAFGEVKEMMSRDLATSKFIAAYHDQELVGLAKLNYAGRRFVNPGIFLSKMEYRREKYLDNALIAKSIETCTSDGVAYFTYTKWRRGNHAEFLRRNGFERTLVPRYWIPLTTKGKIAMGLGLHKELQARIPEWMYDTFVNVRARFYKFKYGANGDSH
jgi:hypothetical protein